MLEDVAENDSSSIKKKRGLKGQALQILNQAAEITKLKERSISMEEEITE